MITTKFYNVDKPDEDINNLIEIFKNHDGNFDEMKTHATLSLLREELENIGFNVSKKHPKYLKTISRPLSSNSDKRYPVTAFNEDKGIVLEIETGRGYTNNAVIYNILKFSMLENIETLVVACKQKYTTTDFKKITEFLDDFIENSSMKLNFKLLIIGY